MLEQKFQELDKLVKSVNKVNVVCCGLYNNGKSTLLNVLVDDFEFKTFKTADIRETTQSKKVKHKNITYIDTPGLNATYKDDKVVIDTIIESDINLFVHNITTGELNQKEIEFLKILRDKWDKKEFIKKTIFVLSRIDEMSEDIEPTKLKITNQIQEIFKTTPKVIEVSAIDYKDGVLENEEELIQISNIKTLQKTIKEFINKDIKLQKQKRITNKYKEIEEEIENLITAKQKKIEEVEIEVYTHQKELEEKIVGYQSQLTTKYNQI